MSLLNRIFGSSTKVDVRSRYELLRAAVSGTMSKFYMAKSRTSGQIVGLKILDREKTATLEARYAGLNKPSEGAIAVSLVHPRIVHTFDHGISTEDEQFLVMEFLDGPGLNSLIIGSAPALVGRRAALLRQAAEALSAVHEAGLVHHDICPRNFVVDKTCTSLKLIDFGLAVPATAAFLRGGHRTGTANYMAPELVRRQPTTVMLDIFSFGVTAYELFTGHLPWARGQGQAAMAHGAQQPIDIRRYCPRIDHRVEAAIYACLAVRPDDRPASLGDFLQRIHGAQDVA